MTNFWRSKKVIAYISLAHHTRFISPVMEKLSRQGAKIQYIVGQAERSQEITAIELGFKYTHVFDFVTDKDNEEIQNNYLLLRKAFTNNLKDNFLFGTSPITVIDKTIYSTAVEYIGFRNLLKKEKPDLCFALHEINRWGKMLSFWAKKENIPFISLQEGLTYGLDFGLTGHAQYSTLNLVWGERIKKKLVNFEAPESKIFAVGNTHLAKEIEFQKTSQVREIKRKEYNISNKFITLLILSSILPAPDLFKPIFKTVSANNDQRIFVKFHPACKKSQMDTWIESITAQFKNNIFYIHTQESVYDLISMADVCVLGQQSTTGFESLALGKPLVKLDFAYTSDSPHSFVDQGVAVKMSAEEFSKALLKNPDFSSLVDQEKKDEYFKNELAGTTNAIETVCNIFKKTIQANTYRHKSLTVSWEKPKKKWSIIIQVPDNPKVFLAQLEAIAFNSQEEGEYETIILEFEKKSREINQILDSLEGDLKRIKIKEDMNILSMMNKAGEAAKGENLIFLEKSLAPLSGWLGFLNTAFLKYGDNKIFGARICDTDGEINNAGMVIDNNNTPVSAYIHLKIDFPSALKERSFQMVNYCVALKKGMFLKIGGFSPKAGKNAFLDICLKARHYTNDPDTVIYLPDLKMIFLEKIYSNSNLDDSIFFYGRWHGSLWESEKKLYQEDNISKEDIGAEKISAAMQALR